MAYAGERIAKGVLGNSSNTLYTVASDERAIVTYSRFYNSSGATSATVTISVYDATDGERVFWSFSLDAGQAANIFDVQETLVLNASDEIRAYASQANIVNYVVCGATETII